jgi:hypothetical protein
MFVSCHEHAVAAGSWHRGSRDATNLPGRRFSTAALQRGASTIII